MIPRSITVVLIMVLNGCASYDRLYFVEESHIGLKAKAAVDGTPGDVDFGYRRSIMTLIPKADAMKSDEEKQKGETARRLLREQLEQVTTEARTAAEAKAKTAGKSGLVSATFVEAEVQKSRRPGRILWTASTRRGERTPIAPARS